MGELAFRVAVTYGGTLGRLMRRLGYQWNHILLVQFTGDVPRWTYESNWRGVSGHPFDKADLAEEHAWYVPRRPLTKQQCAFLVGYCEGATGKLYGLPYWLAIGWRIVKTLIRGPKAAMAVPMETCVTFVNAACRYVGRPVSMAGAAGLPDDIRASPHWFEMPD